MKTQTIRFDKMSSDFTDRYMPENTYRRMTNCRPNQKTNNSLGAVTNIPSTKKVSSLVFDQSVTYAGGCLDSKRDAIIAFYTGQYHSFITGFNTKTQTEYLILKTTVPFVGRVNMAGVIDDYLFWTNNGKARKLNIVKATANPTLNYFLDVDMLIDKMPPLFPPTCSAKTDATFSGNNIGNTAFQFAYSFEYEDGEVSSYSPFSKSVLPYSTGGNDIVFPYNAIDISVKTGKSRIKKIIIAYRKGQNRDWMLAEKIDKVKLSIADNSTYVYSFHNAKYIDGLVQTDVLTNTNNPFYYMGSQAISKDNFLIYGSVKDGLTKPTNVALNVNYNVKTLTTYDGSVNHQPSYKHGSTFEFGVVFRDENGRTDGVNARKEVSIPFITDANNSTFRSAVVAAMTTPYGGKTSPYFDVSWSFEGTAPSWAKTMSIVCLGNKTTTSFVDYTLSGIEDAGIYTYLDISSLNKLKQSLSVFNPGHPSINIPPYVFTKGDRIRFITKKDGILLSATSDKYDYEILGYAPEIIDSAGNVLNKEKIITHKFSWDSIGIGERSLFEIYTPKKEFADDLFFETGEVFSCADGVISITSGTITNGDVYTYFRSMPSYRTGELVADKREGEETPYYYKGTIGFTPVMNVVKPTEGVHASFFTENELAGAFYRNTSGSAKKVTVTIDYNFTTESDNYYWFKLRRRTPTSTPEDFILEKYEDLTIYDRTMTFNDKKTKTMIVPDGQYLMLYFDTADSTGGRGKPILIFRLPPKIKLFVEIEDAETVSAGAYPRGVHFIESKNYSDYYESDEHSIGRPYVEIPKEDTAIKSNLVYTGKYFTGTNIDLTNRINPVDIRYVPYQHGAITYMIVRGDTLKVFTPTKEISFYLGRETALNPDGSSQMVYSSNVLGSMSVYESDYGTANPESVLVTNQGIYYFDSKNAMLVRTSQQGGQQDMTVDMQSEFRRITNNLNQATAKSIYCLYSDKNKEVIVVFVYDGTTEALVYNEEGYWSHYFELTGVYSSAIEGGLNLGETTLVYNSSDVYALEQGDGYNNILGVLKPSVIEFVANQEAKTSKVFQSMSYHGVGKWTVELETPVSEEYPYGQYTKITPTRFQNKENKITSDIPYNIRKKNGTISLLGYANGDVIRNQTVSVKLTNSDDTHVRLDLVDINYIGSAIE
jgi:hypothetical protein